MRQTSGLNQADYGVVISGFSRINASSRADELLEAFELTEAANRLASKYSGGMRRRLDIAAAMLVVPDLLYLDEPTTGLDPRSRNTVWEIVRTLKLRGTTILLTTQYLEEAHPSFSRCPIPFVANRRLSLTTSSYIIIDNIPFNMTSRGGSSYVGGN